MATAPPARLDLADTRLTPKSTGLAILVCAIPVVLVGILLLWYRLAPDAYLLYVLQGERREGQLVEMVTFGAAGLASILLLSAAGRLWSVRARGHVTAGILLTGIVAAAAFFFTMEEISWGQYLIGGARKGHRDLNLHNNIDLISVQSLGSIFLLGVFVALPIAWCFRSSLRLPADLAPAIPEWPVVVAMLVAFLWGDFNDLYRAMHATYEQERFYEEFVEQVNEHKEMLVAIALLAYGCYRVASARRAVAAITAAPAP